MTVKKFSIFTAIIAGIIIVLTIVLSCIKVDSGFGLEPDKINIYLATGDSITYTKDSSSQKKDYKEVIKRYKDMTRLSIMDYMLRGKSIDAVPSQDYAGRLSTWNSGGYKSDEFRFELIFKNKQTVVVNIDGDTKVVEFYSLIMVVKKSTLSRQVAVYFSTTEDFDTGKSYSENPILIQANQSSLFKYFEYMQKARAEG